MLAAGERGSAEAEAALARLCAQYWYPVFAFVRRQGHAADDAQDLTQGFFARLIEKGDLADADRSRGRFRSFLLSACRHFLSNERDHASALKRGGRHAAIPIDVATAEGRYEQGLSHGETPEHLYERQWCVTLLAGVLDDVRAEYGADGRERVFDRLKDFLTATDDAGPQADAAHDLEMTTGAVKVAVHRLRQRYRHALRRRIAETVASSEDVEDELRHLFEVLARSPASL